MRLISNNFFFRILKAPDSLSKLTYNSKKNTLKSLGQEFQIIENIPILLSKKKNTEKNYCVVVRFVHPAL